MFKSILNMCVGGKVEVVQKIDSRLVSFEGQLHVADSEFTPYDWFIRDENINIRFATKEVLGILITKVKSSTKAAIRIKDKK